ncbi:MAG: thiamine pyrophosphate-binding protein [Bacteroidota bacterium]|nr:thiamine pyrophosphate-binding protein [Bacteroidota bacterium]
MIVTEYLAQFLHQKGIDTVFVMQGGMITRIIDGLYAQGSIRIVSMHHEQGASFAADAFSRITNKPGIALATSGPGATNLITGIGSCYFDSVPAIFITGQVNLTEQKGERNTRQIGFQETDIIPIVRPITKAAFAVRCANDIPAILEEAYRVATEKRPGPVLVDIPMDLQKAEIVDSCQSENSGLSISNHSEKPSETLAVFTEELLVNLRKAKRPLVLAGRGVRASGMVSQFQQFVEICQLPVVTSLLGLDVIPYNHPNRIGFIGTYGNRWANFALGSCDCLLVLGSRLDLRQTGADILSFKKGKQVFQVDIDDAELNNRITGCTVVKADLKDFFNLLSSKISHKEIGSGRQSLYQPEWNREIDKKYAEKKDTDELKHIQGINPNRFIHQLAQASGLAKVITTDVGNNQMWTAQSFELTDQQQFLTSGGMGAMGYSLPAAIGACFAQNKVPVLSISGDGGFQINIQELETIKRNQLPIKMVVLNNHCLGMIRQFQDSYFDSRYHATVWDYGAPDFAAIARAYGISSYTVLTTKDIQTGINLLWEDPTTPFLLNVTMDIHTNVFPKTMFGSPITNMESEK